MLVATDKEKEARAAAAANAPAVSGQVVAWRRIAEIIIEPGDEIVDLYYFLDIVNNASTPVNTASLFTFDMPKGATGASLFKESSPLAAVTARTSACRGRSRRGRRRCRWPRQLPVASGTLEISRRFPPRWNSRCSS